MMISTPANREIKTDKETGAKYWSVHLDKLMFTGFEVPANTVFPTHSHESEQITYILDGELFFGIDGETYCLRAGDVISIPSNKEHRVWTGTTGAKAVDAWSPANTNYQ